MSSRDLPSMETFKTFFEEFRRACREQDAAFLKAMLPPDIPEDEFAFVVESSKMVMQGLDDSGVKPDYVRSNNRFDAIYQGDLGDGMTEWKLDFYFVDGAWLKYDPEASAEEQGFPPPVDEPAGAPSAGPPPEPETEPLVRPPASTDRLKIVPLGTIESVDEPTGTTYAYAAWREEQADGSRWRFLTKGLKTAGTALDPAHPSFRSNLSKAAVKGLDHVLVGFSMAPKPGDPRKVETRVCFDPALEPQRVEIRLVTRNADGSPKAEKILALPWPAPEGWDVEPPPAVAIPKSTDAVRIEPLATLTAYDAIADKDYAYAAYKETKTASGKWTLKIKAKSTAGASLDPDHPSFAGNIEAAAKKGERHVAFGFRLEPKAGDPRLVENRLLFDEDKKPAGVEIHLVTRNADGSAKDKQVAAFPWPA